MHTGVSLYLFIPHAFCVAGAMREPGKGSPDWTGPKHFLTDWYTNLFNLKRIPFINKCKQGFYCFYGKPKIRIEGQCANYIASVMKN